MDWVVRAYDDEEIDEAGRQLISPRSSQSDISKALVVVNNWRAAHAFPLNTMQMRLRDKAREIDRRSPSIAQRLKRLPAIESKLRRLRSVSLSTMQDIGGCRAVVASTRAAYVLAKRYQAGRIRHELERETNYIDTPSKSGYRSIHLIYRYHSDYSSLYDDQRIEVQIRSRYQHCWATAVETVDTFEKELLKIHQGSNDWERFFALMGSVFAIREGTTLVPGIPDNQDEIVKELRELEHKLNVRDRLRAIRAAAYHHQKRQVRNAYHYLIELDSDVHEMRIYSFPKNESELASSKLAELEFEYRKNPNKDVLLASTQSLKDLQKIYPNYRADTSIFLTELEKALE